MHARTHARTKTQAHMLLHARCLKSVLGRHVLLLEVRPRPPFLPEVRPRPPFLPEVRPRPPFLPEVRPRPPFLPEVRPRSGRELQLPAAPPFKSSTVSLFFFFAVSVAATQPVLTRRCTATHTHTHTHTHMFFFWRMAGQLPEFPQLEPTGSDISATLRAQILSPDFGPAAWTLLLESFPAGCAAAVQEFGPTFTPSPSSPRCRKGTSRWSWSLRHLCNTVEILQQVCECLRVGGLDIPVPFFMLPSLFVFFAQGGIGPYFAFACGLGAFPFSSS